MAKSAEPVTIKKYANRRLYNTGTSTYVTLEDLAAMVKKGEDFVVFDAKSGDEITRSVLTQIIFEQENKEGGQNLLPIAFLRQLIRFYGDSMQMLVPRYLEVSIDSLTREQEKFRTHMAQTFGFGPFAPIEEQVRRNMEMFERAFAMFTPFGRREGQSSESEGAQGGGEINELRQQLGEMQAARRRDGERHGGPVERADRRDQAPARRDAASARPAHGSEGRDLSLPEPQAAVVPASRRGVRRIGPLGRGLAHQEALQIVAAPLDQHGCGLLVLDPFGDGRQAEPFGEPDDGAHEQPVVCRSREVLHERAVDLDDVDAQPAQVAERGIAGAEIVDRDAAPEILGARDEAGRIIDVLERRHLGDLDGDALGGAWDGGAAAWRSCPTSPGRGSMRATR